MKHSGALSRFISSYGMLFVLLLLCGLFSILTLRKQIAQGKDAARSVISQVKSELSPQSKVIIFSQPSSDSNEFLSVLSDEIKKMNIEVVAAMEVSPSQAREFLETNLKEDTAAVLVTTEARKWSFLSNLGKLNSDASSVKVLSPLVHYWPDFLKESNLRAIIDRIVVISVIAIGMTMIIITGGIDLSVGSMIAFSAVLSTLLIRNFAGAENASAMGVIGCSLFAIIACGIISLFTALMMTRFLIPPFIVTLAMMMVARGLAFILSQGQSIYELPNGLTWLGRGFCFGGIPNTVVLMILLYVGAHIVMSRTVLGRYIYAVGGNQEAARLSGVPVKKILFFVYAITGVLAGLGGIIQASQLKSGAPTYGNMYEMYVIAAVVVGGTSLSGGSGKIFGTLIGAFVIAVIQNGMNLIGIESYTQQVVLGLVILGAVLLDMIKRRRG